MVLQPATKEEKNEILRPLKIPIKKEETQLNFLPETPAKSLNGLTDVRVPRRVNGRFGVNYEW